MIRAASLLILAPALTLAQDAPAAKNETPRDLHLRVDKVFAKWDSTLSPGCALSVIRDGTIIYKRGYGMADLDHDIPITPETVFHVASISKQFTAAAIILLAQEGKISLDDDVHKYIPDLPGFGARITIRQLVHHMSGLRDQWSLLGLAGWRYSLDLITDDDVLDVMSRQKELNFTPGTEYSYCNTGFTLLAQIVKRVSGESLREFTSQRIFQPLGMRSTHFRDDHAEIVKHIAYGYVDGEGENSYRLSVTNFDTVGATSLLTTVEDLAHWDENFYHPRVGGPEFVKQQLERGKLNSGKMIDYAFGLSIGKYRGLPTVGHSGADAGYRADFLRFPEQHFAVACLCNKGETNPSELTQRVADIYLAAEFKEPAPALSEATPKSVAVAAQRLAQYPGLYLKKDDERAVRVTVKDGKVSLAFSNGGGREMTALSDSRFRLASGPGELTFPDAAGGPAQRLSIHFPGAKQPDVYERVAEFQPTPNELAAFAGSYVSQEIDPVYRITVEGGSLVLKRLKSKPETLEPTITDTFWGLNGDLHFQRGPDGKISGFTLNAGRVKNFHFAKP
ncbi:MAG: serine hydrolase domain-containing protein [Bryobacteraceae bacterium]|jgi:CubicO group peptidase (beta-lactamase class C family)